MLFELVVFDNGPTMHEEALPLLIVPDEPSESLAPEEVLMFPLVSVTDPVVFIFEIHVAPLTLLISKLPHSLPAPLKSWSAKPFRTIFPDPLWVPLLVTFPFAFRLKPAFASVVDVPITRVVLTVVDAFSVLIPPESVRLL